MITVLTFIVPIEPGDFNVDPFPLLPYGHFKRPQNKREILRNTRKSKNMLAHNKTKTCMIFFLLRSQETSNTSMWADSSTDTKTDRKGKKEEEKNVRGIMCNFSYVMCPV